MPPAAKASPVLDGDRFTRELVTPEGVDLRVRLAHASERAAAFLLDGVIVVAVLVGLTLLALLAAIGGKGQGAQLIAMIWLAGWFLLRNLYFTLFELTARGATPGKRALGIRVAARNGGRLTADAIIGRNAMRELEVYLPITFLFMGGQGVDAVLKLLAIIWSGVFVLFPLFNRDRLRAGDVVAGTWVVKAPRPRLLRDMALSPEHGPGAIVFTPAQLDAYGVKELHVLEDVLRRYDPAMLAAVAGRIRAKIGWAPNPSEGDGDFLDAYYRALRGRLEGRLLFGRRRKDKHDSP